MNLTELFKSWLIENCGVKEEATDDEFRAAAGKALADGTLTMEKYAELTTDPQSKEANEFNDKLDLIATSLGKLIELQTKEPEKPKAQEEKGEEAEKKESEPVKKAEPTEFSKMVARIGGSVQYEAEGERSLEVRVKEAADKYDTTTKALTYPEQTKGGRPHSLAGQAVKNFSDRSRTLDEPSELDKAIAGAYAKFEVSRNLRKSRSLAFNAMPQHDKELLMYAMKNYRWNGDSESSPNGGINERQLTSMEQKQLIDDATSGGTEAAPIVFDDMVIQTPLLHGELFPLVNRVPIERGRRIEGVIVGQVTGAWGGVDDTAITLFTTTSYVTAFDTTIFRWEGAILVGLDFLSDTPIDFATVITNQYGEQLLEDLDDVIADGNGTTQPEGVFQKTGITTVAWGGATSLGNYESLRFGVAKAEHRANVAASGVFCGNETSYQRARALPVGASDARRLGGMDYASYSWMGIPYKINETLANTEIFYAIMARYRMYVRRGLTIRTSTEGDTLVRGNELLIVAMARYGGQHERGAAAARTTTAPA